MAWAANWARPRFAPILSAIAPVLPAYLSCSTGTLMLAPSQNARWLAIFLPRLSTDRLIRSGRAPEGRPLAIYAKDASAFLLTGVNQRASELGLRLAMSLADARAIQPNLVAMEADPDADARTLDTIAAWCERFTPIVVIDGPDGLYLDITGCAHLFGGESALRSHIVTRLIAQGFAARAAIAPTPAAAWGVTRFSKVLDVEEDDVTAALGPLPIEALRLEEDAAALLRRLGLKRIGQVMEAPRASFSARAGQAAMLRLDCALGRAREALTPRRPVPPVFALRRFLEPLFTLDAVLEATRTLCGDAVTKLDRHGAGALRAHLHLFGVDGRDRVIEIGASRPERDVKALMRLFREKLNLAGETLDMQFGLEAARLDIVQMQRTEAEARTLVAVQAAALSAERISAFVDVASARLGPARVLRAALNEAHAPEKASGWKSALQQKQKQDEVLAPFKDGVMRRPLTLFSTLQPIDVIASVPDGPPIRFRWRRVLHEVVRAEGPERISGDWLAGAPARDYYRVEDKEGRRYWLYREGLFGEDQAPRWFVHGLFA